MTAKSKDTPLGNAGMKLEIAKIVYVLFVVFCLTLTTLWLGYTLTHSTPEDFRVFYESARAALSGHSIYRTYGPIELPYWYLPWLAWFFIPLAFFPIGAAYVIYLTVSIICAAAVIQYGGTFYRIRTDVLERLFIIGMALSLCWLLFRVGQMDFILLGFTVLLMHLLHHGRPYRAGLLVPVLLFKPHLFILFLPFALFKGRKRFLLSAAAICLFLIALAFFFIPNWPQQMIQMLQSSGHRTDNNWNFTTLPNLLGRQENWSGTANLPITSFLIVIGFAILWRFRSLGTFPFLSLALAGSLFCAPRAYSYNFTLLIPAMLWLSSDLPKPLRVLFWLAAGTVPLLFRFSTGSYWIVLAVFIWGILKAAKTPSMKDQISP